MSAGNISVDAISILKYLLVFVLFLVSGFFVLVWFLVFGTGIKFGTLHL